MAANRPATSVTGQQPTAPPTTMQAVVQHRYGPPEVLALEEIDQPVVGDADVLIRVHAAGVSYPDGVVTSGIPYILRLLAGLRRGLGEPNVLLTVRGRRSGKPRTTPVAMFELGDRRFLEAAFGEVDWVRNLRASGEAVIRRGRWSQAVRAIELPPETAGKLLHDALAGFRRRGLLRSLLGPSVRPPAAILYRYRLRIDDRLEDYVIHARRCPWFELLPWEEAAKAT